MKKHILILALAGTFWACGGNKAETKETTESNAESNITSSAEPTEVTAVSKSLAPKDFSQTMLFATKKQIIDVRTAGEYNASKIPASVNINIEGADFDQKIAGLNKATPTFVYCQSGVRSQTAVDKLVAAGFTKIFMLEGGIEAWRKANLNLEMAI